MYAAHASKTMAGAAKIAARKAAQIEAQRRAKIHIDAIERREAARWDEVEAAEQELAVLTVKLSDVKAGIGLALQSDRIDRVMRRICKVFGISKMELVSARRDKRTAFARQAVYYWCCRRTKLSLTQIGMRIGRDHTSVLYGRDAYVQKRAEMGRKLKSFASVRSIQHGRER